METALDGTVVLENFAEPTHTWYSMNDPVMGGESFSSFEITDGVGIFDGECKIVPFLQAPGFITARGEGAYADVSSCDTLRLTAKASAAYDGYRIGFGNKHVPGNRYARGFKANFDAPVGDEMSVIDIPFKDFTVRWDDKTGDPVVKCSDDESVCPDAQTLSDMETISIWGEGVAGSVHLEVESIMATGCSTADEIMREARSYPESSSSGFFVGAGVVAVVAVVAGVLFRRKSKQINEEANYLV